MARFRLSSSMALAFRHRYVLAARSDVHISGADDFAAINNLLEPMCAPSGYTGDSEDGRKQFHWQTEHTINESAIKVDVCADAFIHFSLACDELGGYFLNLLVEYIFIVSIFSTESCFT